MKLLSHKAIRKRFLDALALSELVFLDESWHLNARRDQRPSLTDWKTWILLGGRGAGKTRTGAEYVKGLVKKARFYPGDSAGRIALVGSTFADVRDVMIEGESGILSIWGNCNRPNWVSSKRQIEWPCGTVATALSAADPDQIRGHQFGFVWADEICKWPYLQEAWDMLQFALRLGSEPRQVVTTTPRALGLLKRLLEDPSTVTTRSRTKDNEHNLAPGFLDYLESRYQGTRLGRQELNGELIEDREDGLWKRSMVESCRTNAPDDLMRIVVAIDPPASQKKSSAACGIIAVGTDGAGKCFVLCDATLEQAGPSDWANAAIALFERLDADCLVAEVNQGGEMVKTILHNVDPTVPVKMVRATRGKWLRAEPVAHLYERGAVYHAGCFPELEDQMCDMGKDGLSSGKSPDRVDALVWAITELALGSLSEPRVRPL